MALYREISVTKISKEHEITITHKEKSKNEMQQKDSNF